MGTIRMMDNRRTQTNGPKDKKVEDIDRLYVSRKEEGRGLVNIEDCVDRLEDYVTKKKDR